MLFLMSSLSACIVALITVKRFFLLNEYGIYTTDVLFDITSYCAGDATLRAAVKLFSLINQHVS